MPERPLAEAARRPCANRAQRFSSPRSSPRSWTRNGSHAIHAMRTPDRSRVATHTWRAVWGHARRTEWWARRSVLISHDRRLFSCPVIGSHEWVGWSCDPYGSHTTTRPRTRLVWVVCTRPLHDCTQPHPTSRVYLWDVDAPPLRVRFVGA